MILEIPHPPFSDRLWNFLPVQFAAVAALNGPQDSVARNRKEYQARRDALCGGLRPLAGMSLTVRGSMFVLGAAARTAIPIPWTSLRAFGEDRSAVYAGLGLRNAGEGHVRFALVQPPEVMEEIVRAVADGGIIRTC